MHFPLSKSGYAIILSLSILLWCSRVGAVELSWQAPTTRTDGSAATAAGFYLYYRQAGQTTSQRIDVGFRTTYTLEDELTVGQTYYFTVTAYDTSRRESAPSNEASIRVDNPTTARAPVANNDTVSTPEDTAVTTGNVLANDTDANGDALSIASFTQPARGSVVRSGTTAFIYTPQANFFGTDTFTYTVRDPGGLTATGTVTVTVTAVNDRPVAQADSTTTTTGTAVPIAVLANDSDVDNDPLMVSATTNATGGSVTHNGNTVTYTPNTGFTGTGSFTYTVSDGRGGTATGTVTVTVTAATGGNVGLNAGLVAAYSFDAGSGTTLTDSSGKGNHGTISGATWTTQGRFGKALTFDGVNDVVTVPDASPLDLGSQGSLAAWVKLTTLGRWHGILAKGSANNNAAHNYALEITNANAIRLILGTGTSSLALDASLTPVAGQFYHVAATWDGTTVRLYVNGTLNRSTPQTLTPAGNTAPLVLGRYGGNVDWLAGGLDEVRLYNRALTASEVQATMITPVNPLLSNSQPPGVMAMAGDVAGDQTAVAKGSVTMKNLLAPPMARFRTTPTAGTTTGALPVTQPDSTARPFEFGEVQVDSTWHTVTFRKPFSDPIVVARPPSSDPRSSALVQIQDVTSTGFAIRIQEWDDFDDVYGPGMVSYLVAERGQHTLGGNIHIEAGSKETSQSSSFVTVPFQQTFAVAPVVLTAVVSTNETVGVTTRVHNVTTSDFQVRMQEHQKDSQSPAQEVMTYIAWLPSAGTLAGDLVFEVQKTSNATTQQWKTLKFIGSFTAIPVFLADLQTTHGRDPASLHWENKDFFGVDVQVAAEQSVESAMEYTTEVVGYMAFAFHDAMTDTDGDGLTNAEEVLRYGTDPAAADTDQDGLNDGEEVQFWRVMWNADPDGDGLINLLDLDSDNDGVLDGAAQ